MTVLKTVFQEISVPEFYFLLFKIHKNVFPEIHSYPETLIVKRKNPKKKKPKNRVVRACARAPASVRRALVGGDGTHASARRTSKLARGRCARVLRTSREREGGGGGGTQPEATPLSRRGMPVCAGVRACPAPRAFRHPCTVGMRPRFPRAPRHTPPPRSPRPRAGRTPLPPI